MTDNCPKGIHKMILIVVGAYTCYTLFNIFERKIIPKTKLMMTYMFLFSLPCSYITFDILFS